MLIYTKRMNIPVIFKFFTQNIYFLPKEISIEESTFQNPINPYFRSKFYIDNFKGHWNRLRN